MNLNRRYLAVALVVHALVALGAAGLACSSTTESAAPLEEAGVDATRADVVAPLADASVADARICSPQAPERRGGWVPPRPWHQDKCTPAEVEQFAVACFDGDPAAPVCTEFVKDHPDCYACATSLDTDPARGPIVFFAESTYRELNFVGCVANALGDVSATSCGAAYGMSDDCARLSCAGCLPVAVQADYDALSTCLDAKGVGLACAPEFKLFQQRCGGLVVDASPDNPIDVCKSHYTYRGYIALWCTAPSADAGLDAAADAADAD